MNRLGTRFDASINDFVNPQVTLTRRGRTNAYGLVSHADKVGVCIWLRVDNNRLDSQTLACPLNTARNLTTVRDEDFVK